MEVRHYPAKPEPLFYVAWANYNYTYSSLLEWKNVKECSREIRLLAEKEDAYAAITEDLMQKIPIWFPGKSFPEIYERIGLPPPPPPPPETFTENRADKYAMHRSREDKMGHWVLKNIELEWLAAHHKFEDKDHFPIYLECWTEKPVKFAPFEYTFKNKTSSEAMVVVKNNKTECQACIQARTICNKCTTRWRVVTWNCQTGSIKLPDATEVKKDIKDRWFYFLESCQAACNGTTCVCAGLKNERQFACTVFLDRRYNGYCLRTNQDLEAGTFVAMYRGEVITKGEMVERNDATHIVNLEHGLYCDARYMGNITRFMGHSCKDDNVVFVYTAPPGLSSSATVEAAVFTYKKVAKGTELLLDYNYKKGLTPFACMCYSGGKPCRKGTSKTN